VSIIGLTTKNFRREHGFRGKDMLFIFLFRRCPSA